MTHTHNVLKTLYPLSKSGVLVGTPSHQALRARCRFCRSTQPPGQDVFLGADSPTVVPAALETLVLGLRNLDWILGPVSLYFIETCWLDFSQVSYFL